MQATKEMIDEYRKWYLAQGHSIASTNTYLSYIKRYVRDSIEVNQETVDEFRKTNMTCAGSGSLKSFFSFLVRMKKFPSDILSIRFDRNKQTKRLPKSISLIEIQTLINYMPTLKLKVLTIFIFELGLRISESMKIKWEDFNWLEWLTNTSDFGKVNLKNTKRGKFRVMPVKSELMNMLYSLAKNRSSEGVPLGSIVFNFGVEDYIFDKSRSNEENLHAYLHNSTTFYRKTLYKVSKDKLGKRINPHQLRHSKAQLLMDRGMPIESLKVFLGHEQISTTEIYAQASPEKVKRDLKSYDIFKESQEKKDL